MDTADTAVTPAPVDYRTEPVAVPPLEARVEGAVARLTLDIAEDGGIRPGYKLKLNSYDLGVDIELHDALQPHPLRASRGALGDRHQRARTASSARAPTSSCWASRATPGR